MKNDGKYYYFSTKLSIQMSQNDLAYAESLVKYISLIKLMFNSLLLFKNKKNNNISNLYIFFFTIIINSPILIP